MTRALSLEAAGVQLDKDTGKIVVSANEETSVPHVFAMGDVAKVRFPFRLKGTTAGCWDGTNTPPPKKKFFNSGRLKRRCQLDGRVTQNLSAGVACRTRFTPWGCVRGGGGARCLSEGALGCDGNRLSCARLSLDVLEPWPAAWIADCQSLTCRQIKGQL